MSNLDEGNAFLCDVSSSVCTLMCKYCETTKDYIPKCQNTMKVLFFYMMLVLIFCCVGIAKQ
jgi:hypothetical protein